jgi:F-type H+-transporting ATPase subunit beta
MIDEVQLNVPLLRRRVPNLTVAARSAGLRPATVSDLCNGKIPLGRAEVRTLVALATLAGCSLDELVLRGAGAGMIETGIKVLDLFAPLVRGGTVGLVARQGLGQMVVISELLRRLKRRGFATLAWLPEQPTPDMKEVMAEADGFGTTIDEVYHQIVAMRAERDVFVAADRASVLTGDLLTLRERLSEAGARPITYALVDASGEAPDEDVPYGPLETLWRFDTDLAARHSLPAIDPVVSTSTLLEGSHLEATHLAVQQRARKLLRRYREMGALVRTHGLERLSASETAAYGRGERLEAFLTQPMYVAEPFTSKPGEWVAITETIEGVRRIVDGATDDLPVDALKYVGRLPTGSSR